MNRTADRAVRVSNPRIAVFTLTMNRLAYTHAMLDSIRRCTEVPFDHFVVDNGSSDGTAEYLSAMRGDFAHVELCPENLGVDGGTALALAAIGNRYDYIVKVDNDCEFLSSDWLAALVDVCHASGDQMVLSPYVEGLGPGLEGGYPRDDHTMIAGRHVGLSRHVGGLCILAPSKAYDGFRMKGRALHADVDVAFSVHVRHDLGMRMGYLEDIRVRHMESTEGQWARYPEYFEARERVQSRIVYGERPWVTRALRPLRRIQELRLKRSGGLLELPVPLYLLRRAGDRLTHRPERTDDRIEWSPQALKKGAGPKVGGGASDA